MGFFKQFLKKVHIIEDTTNLDKVKDPKATGIKISRPVKTKVVTLEELREKSKKIKLGAFNELVPSGEELKLTIEEILERANVRAPKHGWTVIKINDRLETDEYKRMSTEQVKMVLSGDLKADRATVREVLQDAVCRDDVLDDYEKFLHERVIRKKEQLQDENVEIEKRIEELKLKREKNDREIAENQKAFEKWKQDKIELEKKMAHAASFLTLESVVSVGSVSGPAVREVSGNSRSCVENVSPVREARKEAPEKGAVAHSRIAKTDDSADVPQLIDAEEFKF